MVHSRWAYLLATALVLPAPGCGRRDAEPVQNNVTPAPAETKVTVPLSLPEPKLGREQLIFGAMRALSAAALGQNDAEAQKDLKGREFQLRLRFGCPGGVASSSRGWSYDEKEKVLRAHVSADLMANGVAASDLLLKGYEGVAGFVVDKPLLLSAGCPAAPFVGMSSGEPTIAIAQLFTSEDSRVQRPEPSYQITKAVDNSAKPTEGLDLVISGRLAELSDGRAIHCAAVDGPPMCIVAAKLDRIAIENPANRSVLGEWSQW